jgi:tetratricopeptide (TPR) repeat protein
METADRQGSGRAWLIVAASKDRGRAGAAACYRRALSLYREAGDRFLESVALTHLGDMRHAAGELPQAREAWQQALTILDDLKHPSAGQVRAKLASTAEFASTADHTSPTPSA